MVFKISWKDTIILYFHLIWFCKNKLWITYKIYFSLNTSNTPLDNYATPCIGGTYRSHFLLYIQQHNLYSFDIIFSLWTHGLLNRRQQHNARAHPKYIQPYIQVVNHAIRYYHVTATNLPAIARAINTQMSLDHRLVYVAFNTIIQTHAYIQYYYSLVFRDDNSNVQKKKPCTNVYFLFYSFMTSHTYLVKFMSRGHTPCRFGHVEMNKRSWIIIIIIMVHPWTL